MKKQGGFTLVELMVVVSITVLLLAWGVPSYSTWKKKHEVENQILKLYGDLQVARMTAYSHKVLSGIWWGGGTSLTSYDVGSDANNDGNVDNSSSKYTIASKYTITSTVDQTSVTFDGRGFLNPNTSVIFYISPNYGSVTDCVGVSSTRITVGKKNGSACSPK